MQCIHQRCITVADAQPASSETGRLPLQKQTVGLVPQKNVIGKILEDSARHFGDHGEHCIPLFVGFLETREQ